eukprot:3583223-Pyramimonas_sp.AAC.1
MTGVGAMLLSGALRFEVALRCRQPCGGSCPTSSPLSRAWSRSLCIGTCASFSTQFRPSC